MIPKKRRKAAPCGADDGLPNEHPDQRTLNNKFNAKGPVDARLVAERPA